MSQGKKPDWKASLEKRLWQEADAKAVVQAWRDSGLSQEKFAAKYGFNVHRLRWWSPRIAKTSGQSTQSGTKTEALKLVPAIVRNEAPPAEGCVVIRLPDGIEVEFRDVASMDVEELGRLVLMLRGEVS